jgi:putative ABC transport system permease protein
MRWLRQVIAVTVLNLQTLPQRFASSVVAVLGIAGVVLVLVAVLSIGAGFRKTMAGSSSAENAVVLRAGATSEMSSGLTLEETRLIADAPGVARGADGQPLASAELFVIVDLDKRTTGTEANVPLRGVQPEAFEVRTNFRILEGRKLEPGRQEILVGEGALREFAGTDLGAKLRLGQADWEVVGIFTTGGTVADSELWADSKVLGPAYNRGSSSQSVYARLTSPAAFAAFQQALTEDPRLSVKVMREEEYYAEQARSMDYINLLGIAIAVVMAFGAIFGAVLTLYSAVASRSREIATLRALGFGATPVVFSVLSEALLLGLLGGALGGGLAYVLFNGFRAATMNWQSFSQVTFAFAVTPPLIVLGIVGALAMGFFGGLLPAVRAAWLPVAHALRES